MSSLTSALNWYHQKIGAYDKQLWEKSVDQRILRGVSAVPKKTARIKTELIDVDLVQGSAFAKAKPQHSWIAATVSGIRRVFLLPFFYNWWQQQTNTPVTCMLILLYSLKIAAIYLYFSAEDEEFPDVPVSEILTPTAMMFMLGIIHSQIVATFCSKKAPKPITRTKRRKLKSKRMKRCSDYDGESKSSPDSASEDKMQNFSDRHPNQMAQESCDELYIPSFQSLRSNLEKPDTKCQTCDCKRSSRSGQQLRFTFEKISKPSCSNEESGLDDPDFIQPSVECIGNCTKDCKDIEMHNSQQTVISNRTAFLNRSISNEESGVSQNSKDSAFSESTKCDCQIDKPIDYVPSFLNVSEATSSEYNLHDKNIPCGKLNSVFNPYCSEANHNFSSDEDLFIAKKSSYTTERWMKNSNRIAKSCSKKYSLKRDRFTCRRYSDVGPHYRNTSYLENHRHSFDSVVENKNTHCTNFLSSTSLLSDTQNISQICDNSCDRRGAYRRNLPRESKIPINIKKISSSGESCADTTTPNTPKPQTSDLEWPLITDYQSDCTDYSSQCSDSNGSDISPSENPFAWEIREPSKKISNIEHPGTDKGHRPRSVSCTIWEHNECKKVDLTALDVSSAIIQKVDSSQDSTEYLYFGVFFALVLSFLPLLFRLRDGIATYVIQDATTDVLSLSVPTSEEVVKITDGILETMLGTGWRVKIVVLIVMLERFMFSLAFFFLLSVAEKTFKQRFFYAKHFCSLTSSRRAKRANLPHFRLNKVRNIKIWLSIRSYLKKLGPQRSVDVIVSIAFILEVCVVSFLCIQILKETSQFADRLYCWELLFWTIALGIYLLRFMIIGSKINKKYRNLSVLITEQINLYLHMEQKPHKKEELILANNVLKLAADLLKELENPFKISVLCANSYLYNITKVIVLSAFSALLTDVLGFKLKLYKIKIK